MLRAHPSNIRSLNPASASAASCSATRSATASWKAAPTRSSPKSPGPAQLCAELGIAGDLIGSNDAQRVTYIVVKGRLVPMPDGLMFMVPTKVIPTALSPLFSWSTKFKMLAELLHPPRPVHKDETVAQMVERHFGAEVVDRLASPLLSGVYGGDAASLSVRAVLPRFVEMEEHYGSLCRAMLAARKTTGGHAQGQRILRPSRCSAR